MTFKNFFILFSGVAFLSCNKLNDIQLNNNPYDNAYEGPVVLNIDSVSKFVVSSTVHQNKIHIKPFIRLYESVILYRNGVQYKTYDRTGYNTTAIYEVLIDDAVSIGTTYTYSAALASGTGVTDKSNTVSFLTQ